MDLENLFAASVLFIILLLAACVSLSVLYKRCRLQCNRNEKSLLEQRTEMEKQNMAMENLSASYQDAIECDRRKTEFFFNMTHELKTPLSVILGAIQLMEMKKNWQAEEDKGFEKNLKIMKYNCYRLLRLTNNLLDLTKVEAGYLMLKAVNCDLTLLLEEIVQSVMPYAVQRQLNLHYSKPLDAITTAVDIEKMERIMLNLLSNAIKFTGPGGTIHVSPYLDNNRVYISVKDSGAGIPSEKQEEVFGRFKQSGNCPAIENEGSGIGLSLVKSFVSFHQGDIRIVSEQGKGCEFIIDLPIRHVNEEISESGAGDLYVRLAEAARIEFSILHSLAS